jgi:hypothetical protein
MSGLLEIPDLTSGQVYGIKTFDGGSAKMQRLPLIPEIFNANNVEELLRLLTEPAMANLLLQFANDLRQAEGNYEEAAYAINNLVNNSQNYLSKISEKGGLTNKERKGINFALRYVFAAMFKTAGNMTMLWGGWTKDPDVNSIEVVRATDINLSKGDFGVQIPSKAYEKLSQTNALIYNILNSILNQSANEIGNPAEVGLIRQKAIEITSRGLSGVEVGGGTGKDSIKIDYKLGKSGNAAVVDINAGNMGIPDGADLLGNALKDALNLERQQVTDSVVEAIMCTYNSKELRFPRSVSIVVLDQSMLEMNADVDLKEYMDAIKRFGAKRGLYIDVNIITLDQISSEENADLLFRYTGRAKIPADLYNSLRNQGSVVLPEPYTNLMADKISAQFVDTLVGAQLPSGIYVPKEVQSEQETAFYENQVEKLVEEAFSLAKSEGWKGIVIKTATKFRKQGVDGVDFPTAFIYPLTELGYEVACSELKPLINKLAIQEDARSLRLSLNQLFEEGLNDGEVSRQVEVRLITTLVEG